MSLKNSMKRRRPNQIDLVFCFDRPLVEELERSRAEDARESEERMVKGKSARTKQLEKDMAEASATIRIKSMDWADYNALLLEHPPRDGYDEVMNSETFFVAAARATAVEVTAKSEIPIPDADWDEFIAGLTDGEHDRIASAIQIVNRDVGASEIAPFE